MWPVLSWWLVTTALGLVGLPIALWLFRHLPGRGVPFARPLGLLLSGYVWWIGSGLGFLTTSRTAILFAMGVTGGLGMWLWRREWPELRRLLSDNRRLILTTELLFAVAFVGWAIVRAYNPDISATEKPMEIAFLNAILRGERFPPPDPWLSGFAISYYYFGYLLVALVTRLSGVAPAVAFNLAIALLFSLTVTGSFGLTHALISRDDDGERRGLSALLWALLGPLFVAVMGNLEGLFEVLHTRGLGSEGLWRWLDISGLIEAPVNGRWVPTDSWWWWRASRVVNDRDLYGVHQEVIDEFPQFSFLLGDMHPHVLALPFVLMALALAYNLLLGASRRAAGDDAPPLVAGRLSSLPLWLGQPLMQLVALWKSRGLEIVLVGCLVGSLGFLNTWDFPIHLVVLLGAYAAGRRLSGGRLWFVDSAVFAVAVAVPAVVLYLPFYLGFQSQAGGVLPVFFNVSRLHQYLIMFGPFVWVVGALAVSGLAGALRSAARHEQRDLGLDLLSSLLWVIVGSLLLIVAAAGLVLATSAGRQFLQGVLADARVQELVGDLGATGLLRQALLVRLRNPGTLLLIASLLALLWYLVRQSWAPVALEGQRSPALVFVYIMAGVGFLLTLAVESVYLRDLFGTRMNTVFKFYYQAWILMALSAAYGTYHLLGRPVIGEGRSATRYAWAAILCILVAAGMVYPTLAIPNRAGEFRGESTLDGMAYLERVRPEDYEAMRWLQQNVAGLAYIVEATGGSYTDVGFVSAFTGLPTVLGWDFHQFQWRGNTVESSARQPDIATIYQTADSDRLLELLDLYNVTYVYVGPTERQKYNMTPLSGTRFERVLEKVYDRGGVQIYRR